MTIPVSDINKGLYFVHVKSATGSVVSKLIVE